MSLTFHENAKRIKDSISMKDYLEFQGCTIKNNRCKCPACGSNNSQTLQVSGEKASCYKSGCVAKSDVIDLHMKIYNMNNIEALNDLISQFNIDRFTGNYSPRENQDKEFKREAKKYLEIAHEKLYNVKLLDYEIISKLGKYEYCEELMNCIDAKKEDLMYNNRYDKKEIRNLYKYAINFYNYIKHMKGEWHATDKFFH